MTFTLDTEQSDVLRELLASALKQLRFETARADNRQFKRQLRSREHVVEELIAKLEPAGAAQTA